MRALLYPLNIIYRLVVWTRNKLYDRDVLKSTVPPVTSVVIGNLAAGGTGKTPHTEYLIRLLKDHYNIATLSRGYKRKTSGFIMANESSLATDIGDEPLQFHVKFPDIGVFVDEDRVHGINQIIKQIPDTNLILLDDAFQHRAVKPHISILLFDYRNVVNKKFELLPVGNYREPLSSKKRADYVIITNSDIIVSPIMKREIQDTLSLEPHQKLLFSRVEYMDLQPLNNVAKNYSQDINTILLFSGIADPGFLETHLRGECSFLETVRFKDHHNFTEKDIQTVIQTFDDLPSVNKIIIITEKDYMRLYNTPLLAMFDAKPLFYIPIKMVIRGGDKNFNNSILSKIESIKKSE